MHINLYRVAFKVYFISAVFPVFQKNDAISLYLVAQQAWMMNVTSGSVFSFVAAAVNQMRLTDYT